jgi:hypothetical protein
MAINSLGTVVGLILSILAGSCDRGTESQKLQPCGKDKNGNKQVRDAAGLCYTKKQSNAENPPTSSNPITPIDQKSTNNSVNAALDINIAIVTDQSGNLRIALTGKDINSIESPIITLRDEKLSKDPSSEKTPLSFDVLVNFKSKLDGKICTNDSSQRLTFADHFEKTVQLVHKCE